VAGRLLFVYANIIQRVRFLGWKRFGRRERKKRVVIINIYVLQRNSCCLMYEMKEFKKE